MPTQGIPEAVRRLIADCIDSIPELEALLLLREHPEREWSADEAGARLYVSLPVASYTLGVLTERGLLVERDQRYRYAPADSKLDLLVEALATAYSTSLVAVTQLVHAKPGPSVQHFAKAFRLRKDE